MSTSSGETILLPSSDVAVGSANSADSWGGAKNKRERESQKAILKRSSVERYTHVADPASWKRLQGWMNRLIRGNRVPYRTPFYAKKVGNTLKYPSYDEIRDLLYSSMRSGDYDRSLDGLVLQIEEDQAKDFGDWSTWPGFGGEGPKKVRAVYSDKRLQPKDPRAYARALERYQAQIHTGSLNAISIEQGIKGMPSAEAGSLELIGGLDPSRNSGAPWWNRGWRPKPDDESNDEYLSQVYNWYLERAKELRTQMESPSNIPLWTATASVRLVPKGPDFDNPKKWRLVMAMPKEEAIIAKTFLVPMIEAKKDLLVNGGHTMIGWTSLPDIDTEMQDLLRLADNEGGVVVSGDISNFDASVPPELIIDVGRMIATWFRDGQVLENLVRAFVYNTALITPTGVQPPGPSSIKSGSGLTNFMDSGVNEVILYYGDEAGYYKLKRHYVLGDDMLAYGPGVDPETISKTFAEFGMESHPDKQFYERGAVHYLQRLHIHGRIGGIASVMRTLNHALGFENMAYKPGEFNSYSYVVRALSQVNNCVFNPYFLALLYVLRDGDKLKLGADITNPDDLVSKAGKAGKEIIKADSNAPWKRGNTAFRNWLANGALRGEELPPPGEALFKRVYGTVA